MRAVVGWSRSVEGLTLVRVDGRWLFANSRFGPATYRVVGSLLFGAAGASASNQGDS